MKDNNKKIIIAIIAVATIIVAIIGATFAFFSASGGSANNAITANATTLSNLGFTSSHSKIATNLVPVSSESPYFSRYPGIAASGEHSCLDDLGNQICSIYEFTVTNTASVAQTIYVSFVPSENTFDNMYFAAFNTSVASANYVVATGSSGSGSNFVLTPQTTSGNSTLGHQATKLTKNSTAPIDMPGLSTSLGVGESITYTILVWLQETGVTQNTEQGGSFKAGVNVTTGGNSTGVTGVMGGSNSSSIYVYTRSDAKFGDSIDDLGEFYSTANSLQELPIYIKHRVSGTMKWCDVENDTGIVYDCFNTELECNNFLQTENYVATDTCLQQFVGDTIEESYVEFLITPEMASSTSGAIAGTYALKGGDGGASYETNIAILTNAFGESNCTERYESDYNIFECRISGMEADAKDNGEVSAWNRVAWSCYVGEAGNSWCWMD